MTTATKEGPTCRFFDGGQPCPDLYTAAVRWAQAYRALQECKRLHADLSPVAYEAITLAALKEEAMRHA